MLSHGTIVDVVDDGLDADPGTFGLAGVTWSATVVNGIIHLNYTTTSTGFTGNFWYSQFSWHM